MKKILIGIDSSKNSVRAVEFASEIAVKFGAEVNLLVVIPPSDAELFEGIDAPEEGSLKASMYDARFAEAASILENKGVKFYNQLEFGQPAEEILKASENYDAIVLGSRGLGQVKGLILGSVSNRVANQSEIPTILVP